MTRRKVTIHPLHELNAPTLTAKVPARYAIEVKLQLAIPGPALQRAIDAAQNANKALFIPAGKASQPLHISTEEARLEAVGICLAKRVGPQGFSSPTKRST